MCERIDLKKLLHVGIPGFERRARVLRIAISKSGDPERPQA
ncbi:MAG: hypothetical protein ACYDCK_00275 [Thermoplasmatota archaeon]